MSRKRLPLRERFAWWGLLAMVVCALFPASITAQVGTQPETAAQVIAQGVDSLSRGDLAWRVVSSEAAPADEAEFGERYAGFAYAIDDPFVVSNLSSGQVAYLSAGQAHFSPAGVSERRSSEGNRAVGYLSIELVTEDDGSAPGASADFLGESFRSPNGTHNLQLTRGVALPAEAATFSPENDLPYLLLVIDGAVQTTTDNGDIAEHEAGTAVEFTGEIEVLAGASEGATWLIASIGSEVEIPPFPTAEPNDDGTGTLEIQLELCPDGFDNACEPTTSENVTVPAFHHVDDENWIIPDRAEWSEDGTTYTYPDLPAGKYTTGPEEDPADNVNLDGARWSDDDEGWNFRIREDRTTTLRLQVQPSGETGSFLVTLYDCPIGSDPLNDPSECETTTAPWDLWIGPPNGDNMDEFLSLFDAAEDQGNGQFLFTNVPAITMDLSPDPDGPDGPTQVFIDGDPYESDIPGLWSVEIEAGETAEATIYRIESEESTGSLFVTLYDCPAGSDPAVDASGCEISSDAWDVGVSYIGQSDRTDWSLYNDGIDMGDGSWWFELLPATTLNLYPGGFDPAADTDFFVGGDAEYVQDGTWLVDLPGAGAAYVDIFRVPVDGTAPEEPTEEPSGATGSLVITQFDCPYGTDISTDSSGCSLSTAPWDVLITNLDTGESLIMTIHGVAWDSGTYVFESIPAGTYSVMVTGNGNWEVSYPSTVDVTADDETYVTIYSVDLRES